MKLRFGIDEAAYSRMRDTLDAAAEEPPVGTMISDVYLDTLSDELAAHGVALRFRRSAAVGIASPGRMWRKQWIWPKADRGPRTLKALAIPRFKQRVDATFSVGVLRWTWRPHRWAEVSLEKIAIDTGAASETATQLRIACRKRHRDEALRLAVELGATHVVSQRIRDRGAALLAKTV